MRFLARGMAGFVLTLALGLAAPWVPSAALAQNASGGKSASKASAAGASAQTPSASRAATKSRPSVRKAAVAHRAPARPSAGQRAGLHDTPDPLDLKSSVALVIDPDSDQILFSKNPEAVLPIASITKLMTALVVLEARQPLQERLSIGPDDIDMIKGSRSRLQVGTELTREQLLHLSLMSSDNRAAHALGRHYPGGMAPFVEAMNAKAALLGMHNTRYVEPTGLSSDNRSSAKDLSILVRAAAEHEAIRDLSTSPEAQMQVGKRRVQFRNTNGLIRNPQWEIELQKTGFISEAGRCVVMQARLAGRKLIMVLLDSAGRTARIGDAERLRQWLQALPAAAQDAAAIAATAAAATAGAAAIAVIDR